LPVHGILLLVSVPNSDPPARPNSSVTALASGSAHPKHAEVVRDGGALDVECVGEVEDAHLGAGAGGEVDGCRLGQGLVDRGGVQNSALLTPVSLSWVPTPTILTTVEAVCDCLS
jgi:hypothetical protein